jgi:hypothetical protein
MMWLKGCPRCGGDLYVEHNVGDASVTCLQCGHVLTEAQENGLRQFQLVGRR